MRTRTRFAILFAVLGVAVAATGFVSIYQAVGRDAARRAPGEAEVLLARAATRSLEGSRDEAVRLAEATDAILEARALIAEGRVMNRDNVVRLALEVAAILVAVVGAACLAFFALSRLVTRGLVSLAAGALRAQENRELRFERSTDPDLDSVAVALNRLLDLTADQERRLAEAARLEGWREVASFLAHQLKNPLAALRLAAGNAEMAVERGGEELARESLGIVRAEAGRLAALINRFRDLAPAGIGSYARAGETELVALLESCGARAQMAGARVEVERGRASVLVAMDSGLLEQALWNLFANAIEAAEGAPVTIRAELAEEPSKEGPRALLVVTDSNTGLDPSLVPRLGVERITTKREGTGLGLVLVRRLLAAQGAGLELYATGAGGLGARLSLPLARKEPKP
jgi:signal transduction histidine kinase